MNAVLAAAVATQCFSLPPTIIVVGTDGYTLRAMSGAGYPVVAVIPFAEARPSWDNQFWWCVGADGTRAAFFAPARPS